MIKYRVRVLRSVRSGPLELSWVHLPETSSSAPIDPRPYLEHLDREMRLLGIMSTFCVAVAALIVGKVIDAAEGSFLGDLWYRQRASVLISLGAFLYAALEFFRQRRHYSFLYGQITRVWARHNYDGVREQIDGAEAYRTIRRYKRGRLALYLAFLQLAIAIVAELLLASAPRVNMEPLFRFLPCVLLMAVLWWGVREFRAYDRSADDPPPRVLPEFPWTKKRIEDE